jgi:spore maturation protein SpmB
MGTTETIFYTITVYFGAVQIKKNKAYIMGCYIS